MTTDDFKILALDGGAASGKSSTARALSTERNFLHVDTGTHYRAVTAEALRAGLAPVECPDLEALLERLKFSTVIDDHAGRLALNGNVPPDERLRSDAVNAAVSGFAALPAVRDAVKRYQRQQADVARNAGFKGLVMDGRDIGTVIFPDADLKVFLFADEGTRARRRALEGQTDSITARDKMDSKRKTAPLSAAADARPLDNSNLTLEQVVEQIGQWLGSA